MYLCIKLILLNPSVACSIATSALNTIDHLCYYSRIAPHNLHMS